MAPLIIAERRIILFLISFIAGIICFHQLDHIGALAKPLLHITSAAVIAKIIDIDGRASGRSRLWLEVIAVLIGLIYVILSGASVSAVRAFIMALLVIFAVLIDRRALTIRNVALAAFVILAINPVAVFGAGFQLSFAATLLLVKASEKSL